MMKAVLILLGMGFNLVITTSAHAITCAEVREKAQLKSKKTKADCVLYTHVVGVAGGSTVSTYHCGATQYVLTQLEDGSCTVANHKK